MNNTQKEEEKLFHNPCPYGNDDCPKCVSTHTADSNWAKQITLENFFELFEFDGVTYKGQRHSEKKVKNHLVKKGIDSILQQERQREREKMIEIIKDYRFYDWSGEQEIYNQVEEIIERIKNKE